MPGVLPGFVLAAIVALLAGLFVDPRGLALFSALTLMLGFGIGWPYLTMRGISGRLRFSRSRVTEGETLEVHLTLKNNLYVPLWGILLEGLGTDSGPGQIRLAPRREVTVTWTFPTRHRGVVPSAPLFLTCGFPFGLWNARTPLPVAEELLIWPCTFEVGAVPETAGGDGMEGPVLSERSGTTGDMIGVRPYRRGDSLRRIHWAQTARHDRLIVCEQQATRRPNIVLLLDLDPAGHQGESREEAIRAALSLAEGWHRRGSAVTVAWQENTESVIAVSAKYRDALRDAVARIGDGGVSGERLFHATALYRSQATYVLTITGPEGTATTATLRVGSGLDETTLEGRFVRLAKVSGHTVTRMPSEAISYVA